MEVIKIRRIFLSVGLAAVLLASCATAPKGVVVNVTVAPEISLPEGVNKISVKKLAGDRQCTDILKSRLEAMISDAGVYRLDTSGLEDPDETVIITGTVDECVIKLGYGTLSVSFEMEHRGEKGRTKYISQNTNRPGAPPGEIRDVLTRRAAAEFVRLFVPTTKKELREFRNSDKSDPGVTAAMNGNWDLAIEKWTKMIKMKNGDHKSLYNRAVAYEASGGLKNLEKAVKDYNSAVSIRNDELYVRSLTRAKGALDSLKRKIKMKEEIAQ